MGAEKDFEIKLGSLGRLTERGVGWTQALKDLLELARRKRGVDSRQREVENKLFGRLCEGSQEVMGNH